MTATQIVTDRFVERARRVYEFLAPMQEGEEVPSKAVLRAFRDDISDSGIYLALNDLAALGLIERHGTRSRGGYSYSVVEAKREEALSDAHWQKVAPILLSYKTYLLDAEKQRQKREARQASLERRAQETAKQVQVRQMPRETETTSVFDELKKLSKPEYKLLRSFVSYLIYERKLDVYNGNGITRDLSPYVLDFLKIDIAKVREEKSELEALMAVLDNDLLPTS